MGYSHTAELTFLTNHTVSQQLYNAALAAGETLLTHTRSSVAHCRTQVVDSADTAEITCWPPST
jgi:hypothetical protein